MLRHIFRIKATFLASPWHLRYENWQVVGPSMCIALRRHIRGVQFGRLLLVIFKQLLSSFVRQPQKPLSARNQRKRYISKDERFLL
jgi:hypothetical protein